MTLLPDLDRLEMTLSADLAAHEQTLEHVVSGRLQPTANGIGTPLRQPSTPTPDQRAEPCKRLELPCGNYRRACGPSGTGCGQDWR